MKGPELLAAGPKNQTNFNANIFLVKRNSSEGQYFFFSFIQLFCCWINDHHLNVESALLSYRLYRAVSSWWSLLRSSVWFCPLSLDKSEAAIWRREWPGSRTAAGRARWSPPARRHGSLPTGTEAESEAAALWLAAVCTTRAAMFVRLPARMNRLLTYTVASAGG